MNLETILCGLTFKNPIIAASGTFGFGREFDAFYDIARLGGISVKGLTLMPREGNPAPRTMETAAGMLNAVGLQNPGIEAFLREDLPWLAQKDMVIMANIAGNTAEEYRQMAQRLQGTAVQMIELNISCPNVKHGGVQFGVYPESIYEITKAVKAVCEQPLMVKLSPNTANIGDNAKAAQEGGADAISLINTLTGMAVDPVSRKPKIANGTAGLSGPAIKPVALRMVHEASKAVEIPIVGMGGIMTGEDIVEFLLCGASAVMVGTANLADPMASVRMLDELEAFMERQGVASVTEWIGALQLG